MAMVSLLSMKSRHCSNNSLSTYAAVMLSNVNQDQVLLDSTGRLKRGTNCRKLACKGLAHGRYFHLCLIVPAFGGW